MAKGAPGVHCRMRAVAAGVTERWTALLPPLNERTRRLAATAESRAMDRDGVALVHEVTGLSQAMMIRGRRDLDAAAAGALPGGWPPAVRGHRPHARPGSEPVGAPRHPRRPRAPVVGDGPEGRGLARALQAQSPRVSATTVAPLLKARGDPLPAHRQRREGTQPPDPDAQFPHIATQTRRWQRAGVSVISVDAKKTEWVGDFKHPGRATSIVGDGGGSHGARLRLGKVELQRFATARGHTIHGSPFPPGTRPGNYVEHRLFRVISMNERGRPLTTFETIVDLIGHTRVQTGLTMWAEWDQGPYPTGIRITDEELDALALEYDAVQGQWNYTISPQSDSVIKPRALSQRLWVHPRPTVTVLRGRPRPPGPPGRTATESPADRRRRTASGYSGASAPAKRPSSARSLGPPRPRLAIRLGPGHVSATTSNNGAGTPAPGFFAVGCLTLSTLCLMVSNRWGCSGDEDGRRAYPGGRTGSQSAQCPGSLGGSRPDHACAVGCP